MAGIRCIVAALAIGSALVALPANAQTRGSASLTHTVSVTVPASVRVRMASLAARTSTATNVSSGQTNAGGISLSVSASRAWVLTVRSIGGVATRKSALQWSPDGRSPFSTITTNDVPVAFGGSSFDASADNMVFRNASSRLASTLNAQGQGETIVLTVSAP